MRTLAVDVPFGLSLILTTRVSGRLSVFENREKNNPELESSGVDPESSSPIAPPSPQGITSDLYEVRVDVSPLADDISVGPQQFSIAHTYLNAYKNQAPRFARQSTH